MVLLKQSAVAAIAIAGSLGWTSTSFAQQPPPPGYAPAYPPPPAYGPAGAPPPGYYYGPPPSYFVPGWGPYRPAELPHSEGRPIPPGYVEATRAHRGLVLSGATVFGGAYLITLLAAGTLITEREDGMEPLVVPVVGPFITMGTADVELDQDDERVSALLLIVDGVAQSAGLAMLIIGLAVDQTIVRRADVAAQPSLVPDVEVGPKSARATWIF